MSNRAKFAVQNWCSWDVCTEGHAVYQTGSPGSPGGLPGAGSGRQQGKLTMLVPGNPAAAELRWAGSSKRVHQGAGCASPPSGLSVEVCCALPESQYIGLFSAMTRCQIVTRSVGQSVGQVRSGLVRESMARWGWWRHGDRAQGEHATISGYVAVMRWVHRWPQGM